MSSCRLDGRNRTGTGSSQRGSADRLGTMPIPIDRFAGKNYHSVCADNMGLTENQWNGLCSDKERKIDGNLLCGADLIWATRDPV